MGQQTTLSIVGAVVGFAIAGPTGAKWGYMAGSMIGSALYPPKAQGGPTSLGPLGFTAAHQGQVLPVVYGRTRIPGTILWYGDVVAGEAGKKGSGGGGKKSGDSANWGLGVALCEGRVSNLFAVWAGGDEVPLGDIDYSFYTGTGAQTADAYMALYLGAGQVSAAYPYVCYIVLDSTSLSNLTFEIFRSTADLVADNPALTTLGLNAHVEDANGDMNPVVCLADFLTHPRYGLGFAASDLAAEYWIEEALYCEFNELYVSPVLDSAQDGFAHIEHLLSYFDGLLVFSQGKFKIHSRRSPAREALPYHNLYETDWLEHPRFSRSISAQVANTIAIEYRNRANDYNQEVGPPLADDWDVGQRGAYRQQISLGGVTTAVVAGKIASKLLWSRVASPFNVELKLGPQAACYEAGDILMASGSSVYAVQDQHIRIIGIEENPDGTFMVTGVEER